MTEIDYQSVWNTVLASLKVSVSAGTYAMFLKPTRLFEIKEVSDRLICGITVGSSMVRSSLDSKYRGQICAELERVVGKKCEIIFKIENKHENVNQDLPLFEERKTDLSDIKKAKLREDYTFDDYAVGGSNQMAFAAAQAVAQQPGLAYNPLFIYGGVGVGKTHLMQAVGHKVLETIRGSVLFCPGEEFINDLVEAIRFKSTDKVRAKYRKVKALLIDDIQFIAGKQAVQEEFFHTYNTIVAAGGQIVMTSDRPPTEIPKLEARLRSRFGAGLIVDIGQPDFELRSAILLIKAKQKKIDLPMNMAQKIAEHVEGVRELEGFLTRIKVEGKTDEETINRLLNITKTKEEERRMISPGEIINVFGLYYGIGIQQLKGEKRTRSLAWPRQILMYFLRSEMGLSLDEVGRMIGGRDHTTVMHADSKIRTALENNTQLKQQLGDIRKKLLISS